MKSSEVQALSVFLKQAIEKAKITELMSELIRKPAPKIHHTLIFNLMNTAQQKYDIIITYKLISKIKNKSTN